VTVKGTLRGEDAPRELSVDLKDARTTNGMWTKQPDQQLVYFATRAWARRYAPEVMLGVYAPEEFDEQPKAAPFNGTTIDAAPEQPTVTPEPAEAPKPRRTIGNWLTAFELAARDAQSAEEANRIICSEESLQMKERLTGEAKLRYDAVITAALQTWFRDPPADDPLDAPVDTTETTATA
jgi:hypothetical protein